MSAGKEQVELWDIYDKDKTVTGRTMQRDDWNMQEGDYHLTVLGVIVRSDGRFLITKRAENKAWAPSWWEVSGGAVMAGEDSYTAVCREVREETGLDVRDCESELLFTYRRENLKEGDNYFVDVYRFRTDCSEEDIRLQEGETTEFRFADREEIEEIARRGTFLHYNSIKTAFR